MTNTEVFTLDGEAWQVRLEGAVLPATYNSKGAALAAVQVEAKRKGVHLLSRDCWCEPEVAQPQEGRSDE